MIILDNKDMHAYIEVNSRVLVNIQIHKCTGIYILPSSEKS